MRAPGPGTTLDSTRAYCPECGVTEHALITARDSGVYLERICPLSGTVSVRIARDYRWYLERTAEPGPVARMPDSSKLNRGCPFDCGPCECHTTRLRLPVVSITNLCNLDCPICFTYNRPDLAYCKPAGEMAAILDHVKSAVGETELINITGGEPTLHPELFDLLNLCSAGPFGVVTMNSNGLKLASDRAFAERLAHSGARVVLSLHTLDPGKSVAIHGRDVTREKQRALEVLEVLGIPTTILIVCIGGVNGEETAELAESFLARDFVRGVTIQNMTFTGENGSRFLPREHVTIDEVEDLLAARQSFSKADFFPLGSYHPLCYSAAYYLVAEGAFFPLSRIIDRKLLTRATADSYFLDGGDELEVHFREGIDRLWSEGAEDGILRLLRRFLREIYPSDRRLSRQERRTRAESMVKMIHIHPHMDEDNFDIGRVSRCGDLVPDESGRMIPACSYNLLYRKRDPRFWKEKS